MEKVRLLEGVKALNTAVYQNEGTDTATPLIPNKIKCVAIKQIDMENAFITACEAIPEDLQEFAPELVGLVYTELSDEREKAASKDNPLTSGIKSSPVKAIEVEKEVEKAKPEVEKAKPEVEKAKPEVEKAKKGGLKKNKNVENFISMLISAGDKGITMADAKKADWNTTHATFYAPLQKLLDEKKAKKENGRIIYIQ